MAHSKTLMLLTLAWDTATVIEVLVSVGQTIQINEPLLVLESDKASMEVPAVEAGTITKLLVNINQPIKPHQPICEIAISTNETSAPNPPPTAHSTDQKPEDIIEFDVCVIGSGSWRI